jgi:hypothetical protein
VTELEIGISWARWNKAQSVLVEALKAARDDGVKEDEAESALHDVYHEADGDYQA